jgi:tetratricopeptide (TPR) repeat protein
MILERNKFISIALLLVILCVLSWFRASVFQDEISLWGDAAEKAPDKARAHNNFGHGLKEAHRLEEAQREFERALELQPEYPDALNNLATIYNTIGRRSDALSLLEKTILLAPDHVPAKFNLAMNYYESGMFQDALREYAEIIQLAPDSKEGVFAASMISLIRNQTGQR